MAEIVIENLRKEFGDFIAVERSTFTIRDGEFFMLLGPSGCGKTTTLRMIAGLELPTSGRILIDGTDVTQRRARDRDIAFVFQMFALYPHMSVRRNVTYPLYSQGLPRREVAQRLAEVADLLGIAAILDRGVGGLSAGDRQRVALARAIVRRPKAFMMDEPLGALDAEFRERMAEELRDLHDRIGATTVYVTHDQLEAMQMGDTIAVMNHGVVEQVGPPQEIYDFPATMFVATFIGSPPMNFLRFDASIAPGDAIVSIGDTSFALPPSQHGHRGAVALGVRPEHVALDDAAPYRGEIVAIEWVGTNLIATIATPLGELKARLRVGERATAGERVGIRLDARSISLFDAVSGRVIDSTLHRRRESRG
jgi:multiple sugar transport system ATP-binding protein